MPRARTSCWPCPASAPTWGAPQVSAPQGPAQLLQDSVQGGERRSQATPRRGQPSHRAARQLLGGRRRQGRWANFRAPNNQDQEANTSTSRDFLRARPALFRHTERRGRELGPRCPGPQATGVSAGSWQPSGAGGRLPLPQMTRRVTGTTGRAPPQDLTVGSAPRLGISGSSGCDGEEAGSPCAQGHPQPGAGTCLQQPWTRVGSPEVTAQEQPKTGRHCCSRGQDPRLAPTGHARLRYPLLLPGLGQGRGFQTAAQPAFGDIALLSLPPSKARRSQRAESVGTASPPTGAKVRRWSCLAPPHHAASRGDQVLWGPRREKTGLWSPPGLSQPQASQSSRDEQCH